MREDACVKKWYLNNSFYFVSDLTKMARPKTGEGANVKK